MGWLGRQQVGGRHGRQAGTGVFMAGQSCSSHLPMVQVASSPFSHTHKYRSEIECHYQQGKACVQCASAHVREEDRARGEACPTGEPAPSTPAHLLSGELL